MVKDNFENLVIRGKNALRESNIDLDIKSEQCAFIVQGYGSSISDKEIEVTFSELKDVSVGDYWYCSGEGEFINIERADVIFKDELGVLIRHSEKRHDEDFFNSHLKYYEFKTHNIKWHN